jgi:hypothetical protein
MIISMIQDVVSPISAIREEIPAVLMNSERQPSSLLPAKKLEIRVAGASYHI